MTEHTVDETEIETRPIAPGEQLHFLESGMSISTSDPGSFAPMTQDLPRGTVLVVTDKLRLNATDRFGSCWFDLADRPDLQEVKWGRVMFARGPWPTGVPVLRPGTVDALIERDRRRAKVTRHFDGDELQRELRAIDKELGQPATVTTLENRATGF